eukprot:gene15583-biopygen2833
MRDLHSLALLSCENDCQTFTVGGFRTVCGEGQGILQDTSVAGGVRIRLHCASILYPCPGSATAPEGMRVTRELTVNEEGEDERHSSNACPIRPGAERHEQRRVDRWAWRHLRLRRRRLPWRQSWRHGGNAAAKATSMRGARAAGARGE